MRIQIENRIGVQASASEVWRHLCDLEAWGTWNPMYPSASGKLQIGASLTLTEVVSSQGLRQISPTVVDWVPNAQIVWTSKAWRGLLRRTRYLEIQTLTDEGCVFSNGELVEGLGARFVPRAQRRARREAFIQLGEALKARVETYVVALEDGARHAI